MNKNLTEIAFVLDRSGSMQDMVEPAIAGFNRFLKEQQDAPGEARLTLVLFDNEYLLPHQSKLIAEVPGLDTTSYVPRGMTALFDAIGRTITELGERLADIPEPKRPGQVIVAIFTDGLENASSDYDQLKISSMIKHQQDVYEWTFLFLGANQDAIASATRMGIKEGNSSTVFFSKKGIHASSASISRKMSALRHFSRTGEKSADYGAELKSIVQEEENIGEQE